MHPEKEGPLKDRDRAHPVVEAWRPPIREIVKALAEGDYELARSVRSVATMSKATAEQVRAYIADFGEALSDLPDETWDSSVSQWMGTHWDVVVDLWTVKSGKSDLILSLRVFESDGGFRFEIDSVHVP